jgi:small multidrug resistance family-3 protein
MLRPCRGISSFVPDLRSARPKQQSSAAHWSQYNGRMKLFLTTGLFVLTALAEIIGCYLPYLWLNKGKSPWLLVPAAISLAVFSWLLTLHPTSAGRVYAAYGGVYVTVAILWLWAVDGIKPTRWDLLGVALCLAGMAVIVAGSKGPPMD